MEMTKIFDNLKNLQDILAKKYKLEEKIKEAPKQLDSQRELLERLRKQYIEKDAVYEEVRGKVEHLKAELAEAEASRESGEKGMDSITTHREYEALDKQITEATERENSVRKDLQKEEKVLAELQEQLHADEALISSTESDLSAQEATIDKAKADDESALAALVEQENAIVPGIDQEIVYKFQRIIKRNSEGIVAVKNGVCTGCHMILPAQFANEVHDGDKILFCPYCSRILYYQEVKAGEEENYFTQEEVGSLSDFDDEFADEFEDELPDEFNDGDEDSEDSGSDNL